ncbi:MAG TPA: hypothetical protein VGF13_07605 [Verrucomicrobiae bacterium]
MHEKQTKITRTFDSPMRCAKFQSKSGSGEGHQENQQTRSVMNKTIEGENQLAENLHSVTQDAENFVRETGSGLSEKARDARARLAASLAAARAGLTKINEKAIEGAKATDRVIRANPYQSIGVAFGVGVLLGVLVTRSCSKD